MQTVTDTELEARVAASAWEFASRDSSDVATALHLTREGRGREIVADLIGCPVAELDCDAIEIDSSAFECEPLVQVQVDPAPGTATTREIRLATDLTWCLS